MRHIDFYMPILRVMEDMKTHEIKSLVEETADYCELSNSDKKEMTRGGKYPKYESCIRWAVTDLSQGGFIIRMDRGSYKITFEGMLMLEENPTNPDRKYLASRSEKFRDFQSRIGDRNRKDELNLFTEIEKESNESKESGVTDLNQELTNLLSLKEAMVSANLNTEEINAKIASFENILIKQEIMPLISPVVDIVKGVGKYRYGILIDLFSEDKISIFFNRNAKDFRRFTDNSELIFPSGDNVKTSKSADKGKPKFAKQSKKSSMKEQQRQPAAKLNVKFYDGKVIGGQVAAEVFAKSIGYMGAAKVAALGFKTSGMELVSTSKPEKYNYFKLEDGYYVCTNITTPRKKIILQDIASALGIWIDVKLF